GTRTFVGGFVAVPESIGAARGQTPYWVEYARNADNTAGLNVKAVRTARPTDGEYTVIEGGLETLELGLEVAKNADADLTYDLTFINTDVLPDGSTISLDPTVAGGVSFSALQTREGKYYTGLLSGTDVGRLQSRTTPSATWVGRLGIIFGSVIRDNELHTEDFDLAIDFDARTLKSFVTGGMTGEAHGITFFTEGTNTADLAIDGKFNDRGIIYGTTNFQAKNDGFVTESHTGTLTGLIGQKGAAAVFYSSGAGVGEVAYAGGFIAVPDRGALTRVSVNTLASYNVWTNSTLDKTTQQSATSTADGDSASTANTAAFTTEVPETPPNTAQISLNMAPLGGDVGDGLIGYAGTTARLVGLLPSTNLGGLPIYTGTATWSGVMQWILGDGTTGVFTQGFTLNVNFD
ncbi:MAG: hypothetical protein K8953_13420, partial [Proteobacteria bacterium]|nr:hypothetical protein [Pseudomonadota bacterium]